MSLRNTGKILTSIAVLVVMATGCARTLIIRSKDRIALPPGSGVKRDDFSFGLPRGKADVLFVVDKTREEELFHRDFRRSYREFLSSLRKTDPVREQDFTFVDFRVQVAATNTNESPEFSFEKTTSIDAHLAGVFDEESLDRRAFGVKADPIFSRRSSTQYSVIDPFLTASALLSSKEFEPRKGNNLFLVFVVGTDVPEEMIDSMEPLRGLISAREQETKVYTRVLYSGRRPEIFERVAAKLSSRPIVESSVDDPAWPNDLRAAILEAQKEFTLTHTPLEPGLIVASVGDQILVKDLDFRFHRRTNSIELVNKNARKFKDPITVVYHFGTTSPILPGIANPARPTLEGEAK